MNIDVVFSQAGTLLTAPLIFLLIARRVHKTLPVFVAYQAFTFIGSLAGAWAANYSPAAYVYYWAPCICLDLILYLCLLVELAKRILTHNRASDSELPIPAFVFPLVTLLFWSLAPWPNLPRGGWMWQIDLRALQATSLLQMSGLVALALWTSLRKLRWPEYELHIITGIGMWVPVQFAVLILHTHDLFGGRYHWLDLLTPAGSILAGLYWLHYFWLEPSPAVVPDEQDIAGATSTRRLDGSDALAIHRIMCSLRHKLFRNVTLVHVLWSGGKSH